MRHKSVLVLMFILTVLAALVPLTTGSLHPKTIDQIDGLEHFQSMRIITGKKTIWSEDWKNQSVWIESSSQGGLGRVVVNGSLVLSARFSRSNASKAVWVYRDLNISLDNNPSVDIVLSVSNGASYGIRFFGIYPNGTFFSAWTEHSYLQHRKGLGRIERISTNLNHDVYVATGAPPPTPSIITRILIYLEALPRTSGDFSMNVLNIASYSFEGVTSDAWTTSSSLGVIINLDSLPSNETLFQLFVGFDISGSNNLSYTLFFVNCYSVIAQGYVYRPKIILTYENALLTPGLISGSPPFYSNNSEWSVILVAQQGEITHFLLDTLTLEYRLEGLPNATNLDLNFARIMLIVYILLVFVIPIDSVIVLRGLSISEQ